MTEKLRPEPLVLQEARKRFDSSFYKTTYGWNFDDVLAMLLEKQTLRSIANKQGVAEKIIGRMYQRIFRSVFGKSGRVRKKEINRNLFLSEVAAREHSLPEHSPIRVVASHARAAGCTVELMAHRMTIQNRHRIAIASKMILINGRLCSVQAGAEQVQIKRVTNASFETHILVQTANATDTARCFIVPAIDVKRARFPNGEPYATMSFPLRKSHYSCARAKFSLVLYEEAWWRIPKT